MNGNGGGPIIQAPSGPGMLHGEDDRQSRTDYDDQQRPEVLTIAMLVPKTLRQCTI